VRVPDEGRLEFRLADGAANPYLLQAVYLAAGLDGMAEGRDPGPRVDLDMYAEGGALPGARRLPGCLLDAIRAFDRNTALREALGAAFASAYVKLKMQEWDAYSRHLSAWERETSLDI